MDDACLAHELVFDHVLVHQEHEVLEALALLELFVEDLVELLVGLPVDKVHIAKVSLLKFVEQAV